MTELGQPWRAPEGAACYRCGTEPPGPGGILCPGCKTAIERRVYPVGNPARPGSEEQP